MASSWTRGWQIPVTISDRSLMQNTNFDRYTHIIFAGGKYKNYQPNFTKELAQWINKGGTIVGIRQGADWIQKSLFGIEYKRKDAQTR